MLLNYPWETGILQMFGATKKSLREVTVQQQKQRFLKSTHKEAAPSTHKEAAAKAKAAKRELRKEQRSLLKHQGQNRTAPPSATHEEEAALVEEQSGTTAASIGARSGDDCSKLAASTAAQVQLSPASTREDAATGGPGAPSMDAPAESSSEFATSPGGHGGHQHQLGELSADHGDHQHQPSELSTGAVPQQRKRRKRRQRKRDSPQELAQSLSDERLLSCYIKWHRIVTAEWEEDEPEQFSECEEAFHEAWLAASLHYTSPSFVNRTLLLEILRDSIAHHTNPKPSLSL